MKKTLYLLLVSLAAVTQALAQPGGPAKLNLVKAKAEVLEKVKLDFSIPDVPAFKALGVDPSTILRPSAAKDFALVFNNFSNKQFSTIPKNVAVEVAPALFIKPWYTLEDYRKKGALRLLTKTRISFGTNEEPGTGVNNIALGLRTTVFDRGDFRLNEKFQQENIFSKMELLQKNLADSIEKLTEQMGILIFANLTKSRRREIEDSVFSVVQSDAGFILDDVVKAGIEKYKKENWNASRMDVAYALVLQSPDTLLGHVRFNKHSFWATLALKPGANNTWAQILLGANSAVYKVAATWYNEFTGNLRFYAGANKFKGLLEVQYQNKNNTVNPVKSTLFTQLGVEASFFNGTWIQFSTGLLNALEGGNRSALRSNLNLSISFPENFKFF